MPVPKDQGLICGATRSCAPIGSRGAAIGTGRKLSSESRTARDGTALEGDGDPPPSKTTAKSSRVARCDRRCCRPCPRSPLVGLWVHDHSLPTRYARMQKITSRSRRRSSKPGGGTSSPSFKPASAEAKLALPEPGYDLAVFLVDRFLALAFLAVAPLPPAFLVAVFLAVAPLAAAFRGTAFWRNSARRPPRSSISAATKPFASELLCRWS